MCALLSEYGYESITVANICKKANVTTGAFYHHYKGKDDLISLYLNEDYIKFVKEHEELSSESPLERFLDYCTYGTLHGQNISPDFLSHFFSTQNKSMSTYGLSPDEMRVSQNYLDRYQCLVDARDAGLLQENTDLVVLNEDTCSITKGITFDWCLSDGAFSLKDRTKRIIADFLRPYVSDEGLRVIQKYIERK